MVSLVGNNHLNYSEFFFTLTGIFTVVPCRDDQRSKQIDSVRGAPVILSTNPHLKDGKIWNHVVDLIPSKCNHEYSYSSLIENQSHLSVCFRTTGLTRHMITGGIIKNAKKCVHTHCSRRSISVSKCPCVADPGLSKYTCPARHHPPF